MHPRNIIFMVVHNQSMWQHLNYRLLSVYLFLYFKNIFKKYFFFTSNKYFDAFSSTKHFKKQQLPYFNTFKRVFKWEMWLFFNEKHVFFIFMRCNLCFKIIVSLKKPYYISHPKTPYLNIKLRQKHWKIYFFIYN